jgi:hypothetical protein
LGRFIAEALARRVVLGLYLALTAAVFVFLATLILAPRR